MADYLGRFDKSDIGFTPTMGALHKGHLSLIDTCRQRCRVAVASIYINPTQFNNPEDFEKYPYAPDNDILLLEKAGCDALYLPDTFDIYGDKLPENEQYDLGFLETTLEGAFRPGHFQGVCMVVRRLIEAVNPGYMFMGLKDYQQVMVIKRLVTMQNFELQVVGCPTLREENGLAMSSRNLRLSAAQHDTATVIFKALRYVADNYRFENRFELCKQALDMINNQEGMEAEYFDIRETETLKPIEAESHKALALVAAYCGQVRLIDNLILNP